MEKIAFLFAGQGSQYVGMGKDLYEDFPEAQAVFDKAEKILNFELKKRCFAGPENMLKITSISQPAILTVSIAALEAFKKEINIAPTFLAGLSLGEYSALIAAGSLTFENGLKLVRRRAELMDEVATRYPGKMAAVLDLNPDKLKEICLETGAQIANLNAPGQVVISGEKDIVERAKDLCIQAGAKKVIELEVNGGFHSSLMSEAARELKKILENIPMSTPEITVVSNYTALSEYQVAQIKENLFYQMYSAVKWEDSMRYILAQGVKKFFEFGPGKVLKGLMRRIDPNAEVINIEKKEDILNFTNKGKPDETTG